jgi:hypothetical protein
MKYRFATFIVAVFFFACTPPAPERHLFFFHNRYLENHDLAEPHPVHGLMEYNEIVAVFEQAGFTVHSEIRNGNVNARAYALEKTAQIDSLMASGIAPEYITVVGTSKGGYIAQYVSTFLRQTDLNYVLVASFQEEDINSIPEIDWSGRVLNIYEKSDSFGVSALTRANLSTSKIKEFKDCELNTGLGHGFLFKTNTGWMEPAIAWAKKEVIN